MESHRELVYRKSLNLFFCVLLLLCVLLIIGCSSEDDNSTIETDSTTDETLALEIETLNTDVDKLAVWCAYWDYTNGVQVIRNEVELIDTISLFAANFKSDGSLTIPDNIAALYKKLRYNDNTKDMNIYLTIVNDVIDNDVTNAKDTDILYDVLQNTTNAETHADEIIALALDNDFDGIEIDYENLGDDMELWNLFLSFESILVEKASVQDLSVRVILEPSAPVEDLVLPDGPEYVVMCYNLYGYSEEKGPKADYTFLREVVANFKNVHNLSFALANGGCDWAGDTPSYVTRADIEEILASTEEIPERDDTSGALYFSYEDDGIDHSVWYADETTLALWAQTLSEALGREIDVSLWRV